MKIRNILLGATLMLTAAASMAAENYKEAYAKGIKEYKAKKYKESAVTLAEAAKLAKTPGEKYNSMCYQGYSNNKLRKFTDAAKVFNDLMNVEKLSVAKKNNAFNQYLHNVYWTRKYKEVIAIAEKTIADDKASNYMKTIGAYLAALSSNNIRKYDEKIKWAKKLQELNPKGVWHERGFIYQAQALRSKKKYKEAEALLTKDCIAKMHPYRQGEALLERGHLKASVKNYEGAVIEYTAVYELPKGHKNHKDLAVVYAIEKLDASGKPDEAMVWVERVDSIKSKYWKALGYLRTARMLQKQGKLKEAKVNWEKCIKNGSWWKKEAVKKIAIINKKLEAKK